MTYTRRLVTSLILALLVSLAGCTPSSDDAPSAEKSAQTEAAVGGFQQTGTITAVLDGKSHTWTTYAAPGDDVGTARWTMQLSVPWTGGDAKAAEAGLLGYAEGFNQGGHFEINFTFELSQDNARFDVGGPASAASIHYRPDGYRGPSYSMTGGTLRASTIGAQKNGPSRFVGTFSGTLDAEDDSGQTLAVTDGSFDIQRAGFEK